MKNLFLFGRRGVSFLVAASLVLSISAPFVLYPSTASAAGSYTASITPTEASGGSNSQYTLTFTNTSSSNGDKMKSATIAIPSGFTDVSVVSAMAQSTAWTTTIASNTIRLSKGTSGADVSNDNGTLIVIFTATAPNPSSDTSYEWTTSGCKDDSFPCPTSGDKIFNISGSQPSVLVTHAAELGSISGMKFEDDNGNGVKDEGEEGLAGWTITLDGDADDTTQTDGDGLYSFIELEAGDYTVCESPENGWMQTMPDSGFACSNDTFGYEITLAEGQDSEDNDFGNFELGAISGAKYNDENDIGSIDGDSKIEGWTIRLYNADSNPWVLAEETETDNDGNYSFDELEPGTYKVCEVMQDDWKQTFVSTGIENESPNSAEEGEECQTVNINSSGETNTRNFGNQFILGSITVIKDVVNPDGDPVSDATVFEIEINTQAGDEDISEGNPYTYEDLEPGVTYTILEEPDDAYGDIEYSIDEDSGTPGAQITLEDGEDVELTITNKQKKGTLTIIKTIDNSHGIGTAENVNEFSVDIKQDGEVIPDGNDIPFLAEDNPLVGNTGEIMLNPGTYTVDEEDSQGYAVEYGDDCVNVVITSGGSATCEITNQDLADGYGAITIIKNLINDNGGTAEEDDFSYSITSTGGDPMSVDNLEVTQHPEVQGITYEVKEVIPEDLEGKYTQTSIVCTNKTDDVVIENPIALLAGHVYECVITNDDVPAILTIIKNTDNEAYNGTFEFSVGTASSLFVTTSGGTGQNATPLSAGTHDIVEILPDGWDFSGVVCDYSQGGSSGYSISNGESINVENGDQVTCTFTNTRQLGNLTVIKVVETTDTDVTAEDFQIHVKQNDADVAGSPQAGSTTGTTYSNLPTGTYQVSESGIPSGYSFAFSGDCDENGNVTVTNEGTATCTITNMFADQDEDGIGDSSDNCPAISNPGQEDTDGDGIGNVCDSTPDGEEQNDNDNNDSNGGGGSTSSTGSSSQHTIVASASGNGTITPVGSTTVQAGSNASFIITPGLGAQIQDVVIDGVSVGPIGNWVFAIITADHTISATFTPGGQVAGAATGPTIPEYQEFFGGGSQGGTGGTSGTVGVLGEETGSATQTTTPEDNSITTIDSLEDQLAGISETGGWGPIWEWITANWLWLLLLLIILAILYYYYRSSQKNTPT